MTNQVIEFEHDQLFPNRKCVLHGVSWSDQPRVFTAARPTPCEMLLFALCLSRSSNS
jgi:hypothetical protein